MSRRIVVTGTDTEIGKTVFAGGLADLLGASYWKPIQSGLEGETDSEIVARLGGLSSDRILPERYRLKTPVSPHQAAAIDGAGRVRMFFHITLPQLRNTMITSIVLMVVGGLTTFDSILILTQGGPGTATTSTSYYMYVQAFSDFNFGPASVIAVLLVVVTTLISIILVRATGWDKMRSTQEGL